MKPSLKFSIDGVSLARDASNHGWQVARESGWYAAPPSRSTVSEREGAHGGVDGPTWRSSRTITLSGVGRWRDALAAQVAVNRLLGLDPSPGVLAVTDALGTLTASVRISSSPAVQWITDKAASWDLGLVSADHRKYGPPITYSTVLPSDPAGGLRFEPPTDPVTFGESGPLGMTRVANPGTAPTDPVITLDGGTTGLVGPIEVYAWETGSLHRYEADVHPGERVILDHANRSVMLNGITNRRELLTRSGWWSLPPGGETVVSWSHRGGPSVGARLDVTVRAANL